MTVFTNINDWKIIQISVAWWVDIQIYVPYIYMCVYIHIYAHPYNRILAIANEVDTSHSSHMSTLMVLETLS
jgi:hypothetical protein